ncbi:hypothetical protein [Acinetobacter ursingii]|uniref:Uncharacterized protein n=1 Tax=Acinetobacter ursingii TaxID=108980 RepID=A0A3D2SKJ0_9GAMM|nr:hypothetical protein [Acinetobacter ursingii]MCH2004405.1 hypothetical protein [Acinetobacter ursingii]MCU4610561.1 hypothetical protein [Acinetobacter ursingii]HCK29966.1 hypothetical protein [Acinetobacter ursingii]
MIISFISKELRDNAINEFLGMQNLPPMSLAILKTILTSFSVAASLNELPRFLLEKITFTNENKLLCVFGDFALHFIIAHEKPPRTQDGTIDWNLISRLQLIYVGKKNAS